MLLLSFRGNQSRYFYAHRLIIPALVTHITEGGERCYFLSFTKHHCPTKLRFYAIFFKATKITPSTSFTKSDLTLFIFIMSSVFWVLLFSPAGKPSAHLGGETSRKSFWCNRRCLFCRSHGG